MDVLTTGLDLLAIVLVVAGVGMFSVPAAMIVAGCLIGAVSYGLARR